jgi:hypothetical protein
MPTLILQIKKRLLSNDNDDMLREAAKAASPAVLAGSVATPIILIVAIALALMQNVDGQTSFRFQAPVVAQRL